MQRAAQESLTLSPADWTAFLKGLDKADRPRPKLAKAAARYHQRRTTRPT